MNRAATGAAAGAVLRRYLPDLIYGASDGIITTLAVVSGVAGAGLAPAVAIVLGLANLVADGFSMGASNVLSRRSDPAGERPSLASAARNGVASFSGFVIAGAIPLVVYAFPVFAAHRLAAASGIALVTLFVIGALRSMVIPRNWAGAGMEMAAIGGLATALAYGIGVATEGLVGAA